MNQMIQMSLNQNRRNKKGGRLKQVFMEKQFKWKSGKNENTTASSVKIKWEAAKLSHAKKKETKKSVDKTTVIDVRAFKIEEIERAKETRKNLPKRNKVKKAKLDKEIDQTIIILKPNVVNATPEKTWDSIHRRKSRKLVLPLQARKDYLDVRL